MGAMTALLVLASLMSALAMEVPKTSYFKVWKNIYVLIAFHEYFLFLGD